MYVKNIQNNYSAFDVYFSCIDIIQQYRKKQC